jgi:Protein of unknown function (DUF4238)
MFQHLTQRAYLERWNTNGKIYLFSKCENRWKPPKNSARKILGLEDVQSQAMETAFANVETCIGHTDDDALIGSDEKANTFATWIALHGLRNARNADSLKNGDYKRIVEELAHYLRLHYAFFLKTPEDALITCDNPITKLRYPDAGEDKELFFAPISPRRAVVIVQDDKVPVVSSQNWNESTFRNATDICVSWDSALHFDPTAEPFSRWPQD